MATNFKQQCLESDARLRKAFLPLIHRSVITERTSRSNVTKSNDTAIVSANDINQQTLVYYVTLVTTAMFFN